MRTHLLICFLLLCNAASAQRSEGLPKTNHPEETVGKRHSPTKATLLSAALPGAGQVYNQRNWWWKVPVIYGAGGALLYGAIYYQSNYNSYRAAYKERLLTQTNSDPKYTRFQTQTLQVIRDSYREARDQCYLWLVIVYASQIMDAAVEAHFFDFNVNENVSLKLQPQYDVIGNSNTQGVQLTLKF